MKCKYLIGIDEAGRGPLAGPVAVGAVVWRLAVVGRVKDSKQLSSAQREEWFEKLLDLKQGGKINFATTLVGQKFIDKRGIVSAVRLGIARCLERLKLDPNRCLVLLDGGLRAPAIYQNQRTIIRGDETEAIIALASIAAKVRRDRRMAQLATVFPQYGFDRHKGYGTRAHYQAIRRFGLSPLHRRSFTL